MNSDSGRVACPRRPPTHGHPPRLVWACHPPAATASPTPTRGLESQMRAKSPGNSITEIFHMQIRGGGCRLRRTPVLARIEIGSVPVPPVVLGMALFIRTVMLGGLPQ